MAAAVARKLHFIVLTIVPSIYFIHDCIIISVLRIGGSIRLLRHGPVSKCPRLAADTQLRLPHALQSAVQSAQGGVNLQQEISLNTIAKSRLGAHFPARRVPLAAKRRNSGRRLLAERETWKREC